jgi:hypothetical protein
MIMKNKLIEIILCERYNKIHDKKCDCNKIIKEDVGFLPTVLAWITGGKNLPGDIIRTLFSPAPRQDEDVPAKAETRTIPQLQDPNKPGAKTPTMTKIREFGNATGGVISPS